MSKVGRNQVVSAAQAFMNVAKELGIVDHGAVNSMHVSAGSVTNGNSWSIQWLDAEGRNVFLNYNHGCDLAGAYSASVAYDRLTRATGTLRTVRMVNAERDEAAKRAADERVRRLNAI